MSVGLPTAARYSHNDDNDEDDVSKKLGGCRCR